MVFTGLLNKLKNTAKAAKFASGVALGSLASLAGYSEANAQTPPYFNFKFTLEDSNQTQIQNGGTLVEGNTYLAKLSLENISGANIDVSSLATQFKATFGGLANSANVDIQYTPGTAPSNISGVPANDLFVNSDMTNNNLFLTDNNTNIVLNYDRAATTNLPVLNNAQSLPFMTFTITPQSGAVGGNVSFNYLTGGSETALLSGPGFGDIPFNNSTDLQFQGFSPSFQESFQVSFAAVPEPSTYALMAGGSALVMAAYMRKRQRYLAQKREAEKKTA